MFDVNLIKKFKRLVLICSMVIFVIVLLISSITTVNEGTVGVKYRFGTIVGESIPAGLHFLTPFIDSISTIDITEQSKQYQESCYTKDIQTVEAVSIKVNYKYDTTMLSNLIRNVGIANVESKIVKPQVESILKNEIGKYKGEELIANRTVIQDAVEDQLRNNLIKYGINVIKISFQNIDFDRAFESVIAEKVAAEQRLLTTRTKAEEQKVAATGSAEAEKIAADAKAYSIKVVNDAIKAMDSDAYVRLQWINKWNGNLPNGIIDSGAVIYDVGQGVK